MKRSKGLFFVFLSILALGLFSAQPVSSQTVSFIYITSDGSIITSANETVPIQRVGDVYTFTGSIIGYSLVIERNNIVVDGGGYSFGGQGEIGIDLSSRSNVVIRNMQIGGYFQAIRMGNTVNATISGNTFVTNGYGIVAIASQQNTITGNTFTGNDFGIDLESSSNNVLRNNTLDNNYNIAVWGSEPSHFVQDADTSNIVNGKKLYYFINEANLVIDPTTYSDVGFLALVDCTNITVLNIELTKNTQGILLAFTTDSTIFNNEITANYIGLRLFSSSNNFIIGNNIVSNYRGVQLSQTSNLNSISSNNITDGGEGIFIFDSTQNNIELNNITDNAQVGIGLKTSSSNVIRGNYIINNRRQVYDVSRDNVSVTASTNIWDLGYPVGGNYWNDYTGVDLKSGENQDQEGSDGLGDTPYIIYGNQRDNFPLLPFGSPLAITISSPENKTYTVTSVSLLVDVNVPTLRTTYSLDGQAQVEFTGDITLEDLAIGSHGVTVYVTDQDGLEKSATVYFTVAEEAEPPQSEFPITYVVVIGVVVVVAAIIVFYFMRYRKKKNYSGVNRQQGRVQLDSDSNE